MEAEGESLPLIRKLFVWGGLGCSTSSKTRNWRMFEAILRLVPPLFCATSCLGDPPPF